MELGSLTKVYFLGIGSKQFDWWNTTFFGKYVVAYSFSVAYNNLEGNIPESIGHLKSLSFFSVTTNKLIGMVPSSLYNISSISSLILSQNQLNSTLPENIALTLPNLQQFTNRC
jgi:hypothetical protein